jgi:hypothetical protein
MHDTHTFQNFHFAHVGCETIEFSKGQFDPALGEVRVVMSTENELARVWVQDTTSTGFTTCMRIPGDQSAIAVEYFAFQRSSKEHGLALFAGSQAGSTPLFSLDEGGTGKGCSLFQYDESWNKFAEPPIIVGSLHYADKHLHDAFNPAYWIERMDRTTFRVCVQDEGFAAMAGSCSTGGSLGCSIQVRFDWLAVPTVVPAIYLNQGVKPPYSLAGVITDATRPGQLTHCQTEVFDRAAFATPPQVLVTVSHYRPMATAQWLHLKSSETVSAFVRNVTTTNFTVCSLREVDNGVSAEVSYVVFGDTDVKSPYHDWQVKATAGPTPATAAPTPVPTKDLRPVVTLEFTNGIDDSSVHPTDYNTGAADVKKLIANTAA